MFRLLEQKERRAMLRQEQEEHGKIVAQNHKTFKLFYREEKVV